MTVRQQIEQHEKEWLAPNAAHSASTRGRDHPLAECPWRTAYQRDRDRILHCKAFRRLKHKTQVFLSPEGDHYRTRLTHTLEVSQIARTIARALRLNEDLTEAIALGHDLGHTPFGHAGERALDAVSPLGFQHYIQSVRVVERLEKDGEGLNLTVEVRDGIRRHTKGEQAATLEGQLVRAADRIAYINHDIDDAIRAGVLVDDDIPVEIRAVLGEQRSDRLGTLIQSVIKNSKDSIQMGEDVRPAFDALHTYMFDSVYLNAKAKSEEGKAMDLVAKLYRHFTDNPDLLPGEFADIYKAEGADLAALDYIAGMSDRYAVQMYESIFIPRAWSSVLPRV